MSERIKCPSCGAGLILSESARGAGATCPRCLAMVSAPETGREPGAIQAERPERRENAITAGRYGRVDLDVRGDTEPTGWTGYECCFAVVLVIIIGGMGVGFVFIGSSVFAQGGYGALFSLACALIVGLGLRRK